MTEHVSAYKNAIVRAYPKTCNGCQDNGGDVMISGMSKGDEQIVDFFLSTENAQALYEELGRVLKANKDAER